MASLNALLNDVSCLRVGSPFTEQIVRFILSQLCCKSILSQPGIELYVDVDNLPSTKLALARLSDALPWCTLLKSSFTLCVVRIKRRRCWSVILIVGEHYIVGWPQGKLPLVVCTALLALLAHSLTVSSFMSMNATKRILGDQNVSQESILETLKMMC